MCEQDVARALTAAMKKHGKTRVLSVLAAWMREAYKITVPRYGRPNMYLNAAYESLRKPCGSFWQYLLLAEHVR